MNIKDFAEKFIKAEDEAWQNGNCDILEKLEDPKVVYHIALFPDAVGFEAHKQMILGSRMAMSDIKQEWKYLAGEGNIFALAYKCSYVSTGKVPSFPPAGKTVSSDYLFVFCLKSGRVIEAFANGNMTIK